MEIIFENDWMQISIKNEKYFIKYNSGDLINSIKEIEISKNDAEKAALNEQNAYDVIIKYQNLKMFGREK